ncbi:integrase catalytic region [Caballeronia glebae]|uniref:Integrase catalytic region n=1 Tax=Caballeronia glebae TaxID=1777143 RepID=A0A158ASU4_9BURK|nr:integrase catalytic region [Caballeronia glebae]
MRTILGFKNFHCARILLSGIELMHMIGRGQMQDRCIGYTYLYCRLFATNPYRDKTA